MHRERYRRHMVLNVHEREIAASADEVGLLIDSLASVNDRLWPWHAWPAMRFDGPLREGAVGGHGPVRYFVSRYEPGRRVQFQFTGPAGFNGYHSYIVIDRTEDSTLLRHELAMTLSGWALLTWPLVFRPLHDALIEESLDRAESECGSPPTFAHRRSLWTKTLRALFTVRMGGTRNEAKP